MIIAMPPKKHRPMGKIEKRDDGWWIVSFHDWPDHGPYDTKADAAEDRKGLTATYHRHKDYWDQLAKEAKIEQAKQPKAAPQPKPQGPGKQRLFIL